MASYLDCGCFFDHNGHRIWCPSCLSEGVPPAPKEETTKTTKILALHGGGDWADASAEYLVVPSAFDTNKAMKEFMQERKDGTAPRHKITFIEWLIEKHGAYFPHDNELEIVNADI